ncbi:MAG: 50S ribosomal protein L25 [Patescibacteria group bacterium]
MTSKLEAATRTLSGKKLFKLRQQDKIPAVIYGHGSENKSLELGYSFFSSLYQEAGENTIIDLVIDGGAPVKALIADVQYNPLSGRIQHVDFQTVKMDEKIHAHVSFEFIGECRLVKEEGGVLIHNLDEVEIYCLPGDLIHEIEIDLSVLKEFGDVIAVKDLKLSQKVEIIGHEPEDVIVTITRPREEKEEVVAAPAEEVATSEVKEAASEKVESTEKQ